MQLLKLLKYYSYTIVYSRIELMIKKEVFEKLILQVLMTVVEISSFYQRLSD